MFSHHYCWFSHKTITIMAVQVPFKKPLRKALHDTAAVAKNKFV